MTPVPGVDAARDLLPRVMQSLRAEPLVTVAGVLGVLLAITLLALLIRRWRRSRGAELKRLLESRSAVTILMHPNPDPDAMATALALEWLAKTVDTATAIQYSGEISHQENRAFRTVFDCDFDPIQTADDIAYESIVLVDHNEQRGFTGCERLEPDIVIDHHPGDGRGRVFTDVRPEYGACASIIAEYFQDLNYEPAHPDQEDGNQLDGEQLADHDHHFPSLIATGLMYGILSDTNRLTAGCSPAEFDAAAYLSPGVDSDALDRIANPPVDAAVLDTIATAVDERIVRPPFAVSDVGTVENADAIPQAADELLQLEGITAAVVIGDVDDTIHLSGRSRDDRVHMGDALAAVVDDIPMSSAGGHARMGGGQISLTHMEGLREDSGISRPDLADRLFAAMGGDAKAISTGRH